MLSPVNSFLPSRYCLTTLAFQHFLVPRMNTNTDAFASNLKGCARMTLGYHLVLLARDAGGIILVIININLARAVRPVALDN